MFSERDRTPQPATWGVLVAGAVGGAAPARQATGPVLGRGGPCSGVQCDCRSEPSPSSGLGTWALGPAVASLAPASTTLPGKQGG